MPQTIAEMAAEVQAELIAEGKTAAASDAKPISTTELDALDGLRGGETVVPKEGAGDDAEDAGEEDADAEAPEPKKADEGKDGEPAKAAEPDGKGKKPGKPKVVPEPRYNEVQAKLRQAERETERLRRENEALKANGKEPTAEEKIRADERAKVIHEQRIRSWIDAGDEEYPQASEDGGFQRAQQILKDAGFTAGLVDLAIEACDGDVREAARAIYRLSKEPPEALDRFGNSSRETMSGRLARLAAKRPANERRREAETEEPARDATPQIRVSKAPPPIRPLTPTAAETDDLYDGKADPDEFYRRASKNPRLAAAMGVEVGRG